MTRKDKSLTGDDQAVWAFVTADVAPIKGKTRPTHEAVPAMKAAVATRSRSVPVPPAETKSKTAPAREMDKRTRERFEGGKMAIDAVLDLHGSDRGDARVRLNSFLTEAWQNAMRCVLVITGKGRGGEGVIRSRLPDWVEEPGLRSIVLGVHPARAKDGGSGAFYVLLRRHRPQ